MSPDEAQEEYEEVKEEIKKKEEAVSGDKTELFSWTKFAHLCDKCVFH